MQALLAPLLALAALRGARGEGSSPISKVLSMLSDLQAKVIHEGEAAQLEYAEFAEWCEDRSKDLGFEIKSGQAEEGRLKASINDEAALIASHTTKVEELAADISKGAADLKAAAEMRAKENADFAAEEKELMETIDMVERATGILEREAQGGASMLQLQNAASLTQAFAVMLQASLISTAHAARLAAFVQEAQGAEEADGDGPPGAPAADAYAGHSSGIIDTLQDLTEKAEAQLAEARKKETTARNNHEVLKQSLEDEVKFATKELDEAKKGIAESSEKKSTAEGELTVASKELAADVDAKRSLHHDCMTKAEDFEAETNSRAEELKALAEAKKIIKEATGGGSDASKEVSLMQVSRSRSRQAVSFQVLRFVRDLAYKQHSNALVQLVSRITAAMRDPGGDSPMSKVQVLISDMIARLEDEADADASKKAYCDKELAETQAKKEDKGGQVQGLTTKIEQMAAKSAKLNEEVAALQSELSKLTKSQAEMDKLRQEEKTAYEANKAEQEKGLEGVKLALKVLNEYYAQKDKSSSDSSSGAASGIIGLLEVIESDISKDLAEITTAEEMAVSEYERVTKENGIERATKEQDVVYKTKESKELDKSSAEATADRTGVQAELDAVLEYLTKIEEQCIAKPEAYEDRVKRRAVEIAGLKEALTIIGNEAALLQWGSVHRTLRGRGRRQGPAALSAAA